MSLKTRTITGVIFGAVMIGGTLASAYSCATLFIIVGLCCLWEFTAISNPIDKDSSPVAVVNTRRVLITALGILPALWIGASILGYIKMDIHQAALLLPIFFGLFIFELFGKSNRPFEQIGLLLLAILYIGVPTALVVMIALAQPAYGNLLVMAMLSIVWASDSFAYLGGSQIGKTPFFKRISPKKTWEGIACGVAGAMLVGYICSLVFVPLAYSVGQWVVIAVVACVFGILGDLVESLLKRSLGIKDSGTILPGHGGFLDRFDAFILLVPFTFFAIVYLLNDSRFTSWL
jgi:phosphatidate cytidylyltransferase